MNNLQTNLPPSHGAPTSDPVPRPTHSAVTTEERHGGGVSPITSEAEPSHVDLRFRPAVLRTRFLVIALVFNLAVFGVLFGLYETNYFTVDPKWSYLVLQVLPIVVGTITAANLEGIIENLSRITPFMRCAESDGDIARNTIFQMFRPVQPLSGAIATKNWLLSVSHFYLWLTFCLQGLKASLLVTDGENSAFIVPWALFAIIVAYGMISLYIMYVIYYLHNRVTGLREEWDVVTIADHLALFRHSNFLDKFEGSCIADRDSMIRALGNLKIKLGYWPREGGSFWYGFNELDVDKGNKAPERAEDRNVELSVDKLSTLRYNSVPAVMQPLWLLFLMISAVLMSGGYTAALGLGADQSYTFNVPVSTDIARFLLSFLVTSFSVFFLDYWRNVKLFAVMSQPFVHLDTGGNADETLLLDYTCSHQIVAIYEALGRKHWEVALSSALAILHRGLPILVGASIGVWDENERTLVEFSLPMSVIIIVSMVPSVVFVLYEFFWAGYSRHLPRDYICIADLLSWTCSGHILRTDVVDQSEHGSLRGNPFDNRDGTMAKRWYLEARLRLANLKYRFDLENIRRGRNQFSTMGLTSSTAATGKLRTPGKGLLRRRKKTEACDGGVDTREESFTIAGAGRFKIIDGSESNFVHENSGVGYALTTLQADDRAAAEDTEAAE